MPDKLDVWGIVNKIMYGVIAGLFIWVWNTNGRVIRLETQREATVEKINNINTKVDKIYDMLLEDARSNP